MWFKYLSPSTPAYRLAEIANTENQGYILAEVAAHPNTPAEVLENFVYHGDEEIREALASNANAPEEILNKLANDPCPEVKIELLYNPSVPDYVLYAIVENEQENLSVRLAVTENWAAPGEVLRTAWRLISRELDSPNKKARMEKESLHAAMVNLAANPRTPETILMRLACIDDIEVQKAVLANKTPSPTVLDILCGSDYPNVRLNAQQKLNLITV